MSSYVERLAQSFAAEKPRLKALIRIGAMKIPEDKNKPLIIIAVGAGISVFKGMLQERIEKNTEKNPPGEVYVYYGCRDKTSPYLKELLLWKAKKIISKAEVALSRIAEGKKYIQDTIKECKNEINTLVKDKEAIIMVCASLVIEQAVREALIENFKEIQGDQEDFFGQLKDRKQYLKELWNF